MRSAPSSEVRSVPEALALLGLVAPTDPTALTRAFRIAVKAARPDQPGGDADRFRRVIAAWRLLQQHGVPRAALAAPVSTAAAMPVIVLTPMQAIEGARTRVTLNGRRLSIAVPPGLRTGDHVRLRHQTGDDTYLPVLIRADDGLSVLGDDLFMDWPVARRLLDDGGRVEIDTHAGLKTAWIVAGMAAPVRLRLKGLGLPARGSRPCGHLLVTLTPAVDAPSVAEDLLARFSRVWMRERMAA